MSFHESGEVKVEFLQAFGEAWNQREAEALMSFMTDDCVFETSTGPDPCGRRIEGRAQVQSAFAEVWVTYPDAHWVYTDHFVCGDRGVSEWTFNGKDIYGTRIEVNGCDLFTFREGKIALKNSFRKNRRG